ncbi:MAG TPA: PQQ-binding-like beta-propeller repeat protein, partial [Ktedonobacteraceae bacterium]
MKRDKAFPSENIDEQIEHSIATSFHESSSPESKMVQRLSTLYEADRRSAERVEQRLAQHLARHHTSAQPPLKLLTPVSTKQEERKPSMLSVERPAKRGSASRLMLVAAALFVSLLVGSLLMVLNLARASHTGGQISRTAGLPTTTAGIYFNRANEVYRLDSQTRKVVWHTHLTKQPVHIIANKSESVVGKPTVIGANVYISADNMLTALDAQTGKFRWSRTFDGALHGLGPFEDNGQLYVIWYLKNTLAAINPANGTTIATYTPLKGQGFWNDPTVVNGVLYYQTGDTWSARIYAVQLPSEKLLWQAPLSKQQMYDGILVQDGVVYIQSQIWNKGSSPNKGRVEAFDAGNGHKIWQSPDLSSPVRTIAVANNLIYIATVSNGLMAFDRQAHTLSWQKPYNTFAIQAYNSILYVGYQLGSSEGDPAVLAALNTTSGQPLWQKNYGRNSSVETIAVSGGIFYCLSWTVDGNQGALNTLNASSGTQLWTMPIGVGFLQWG